MPHIHFNIHISMVDILYACFFIVVRHCATLHNWSDICLVHFSFNNVDILSSHDTPNVILRFIHPILILLSASLIPSFLRYEIGKSCTLWCFYTFVCHWTTYLSCFRINLTVIVWLILNNSFLMPSFRYLLSYLDILWFYRLG